MDKHMPVVNTDDRTQHRRKWAAESTKAILLAELVDEESSSVGQFRQIYPSHLVTTYYRYCKNLTLDMTRWTDVAWQVP